MCFGVLGTCPSKFSPMPKYGPAPNSSKESEVVVNFLKAGGWRLEAGAKSSGEVGEYRAIVACHLILYPNIIYLHRTYIEYWSQLTSTRPGLIYISASDERSLS